MKYAVLIFLLVLSLGAVGQNPKSKTTPVKKPAAAKPTPIKKPVAAKPKPVSTPTPLSEKEQFEKASAHELASARVPALEQFLTSFPQSEYRPAAIDLLASSRVLIADEKLLAGESADAVLIFRRVVEELPQPIPDELFTESIARIPSALFRRGQRVAAAELAMLIESKAENSANQLVEIANFYISIENGAEAMRVAAKAAAKDPKSPAVFRTLALAHRINFDLELSADSYAKALELEPDSIASKRGLAEMKRALGKSDDAVALYRELLAKNDADSPSRTGLVLSLFDAGQRTEAEAELAKAPPGNFVLLAGAAYWYASRGIGDKAVELAQKAIEREPRYIWSHIALARGLLNQGKPVAAEQVLVKARAFGNFPTLEYELASARIAAGFYREAVEDLAKQFSVSAAGVSTRLGGRLAREEKSLADLVAHERRASIFAPKGADTAESAEILKALLELDEKLNAEEPNEAEIAAAAEAFTKGTDKMKLHRQLYAATTLLQKRIALSKVVELTKAATGNTDAALDVADPGAAVMANELYEARAAAFRKNDFLVVPTVPKQTLSAILRGRIEETAGWALYHQNNFPDAVVRLRRAVTVMPDDSAWWRSSMWRLGAALAADGKDAEALNAYIESYRIDTPDFAKYTVVEALYKKINGTTDGLEAKIGRERVGAIATTQDPQPTPTPASVQTTDVPAAAISTEKAVVNTAEPAVVLPTPEPVRTEPIPTQAAPPEKAEVVPAETPARSEPRSEDPKRVDPPVNSTEVITEPAKPPVQEPKAVDVKVEDPGEKPQAKPADETTAAVKKAERPVPDDPKAVASKPLFEPIIITVPSRRPAKPPTTETATTPPGQEKPAENTTESKTAAPPISSGESRPRMIDGQEVKVDEPPPCNIVVSQENISLINNGGRIAILVHLEGGDINSLTTVASSTKDIEITLQPEIAGFPDRRFYVIKSISAAIGVYQVTFAAPCGRKEVIVSVR